LHYIDLIPLDEHLSSSSEVGSQSELGHVRSLFEDLEAAEEQNSLTSLIESRKDAVFSSSSESSEDEENLNDCSIQHRPEFPTTVSPADVFPRVSGSDSEEDSESVFG